jgi:RimJ/RimL family protein N-acetyltransferase/translation initiation factor IF-1
MIEQDVSARLHPGLIELQREQLKTGYPLRARLYGMSMYPIIRPGDVVQVRPVEWTALRRGDILYYERECRLVAHRVMVPAFDDAAPIIAKGDTLENFDPPILPEQLMGRVEALERGSRIISLVDRRARGVQRLAAELSGPYSSLFWKVAALRRRILRKMLAIPAYRRARRRSASEDVTVRPYLLADADHLANCLWDLQPRLNFAQMRDWTARRIEELNQQDVAVRVVEERKRIVGVAALHPPDEGGIAWLTDGYLHPLVRGLGYGIRLLSTLEREAQEAGGRELITVIAEDSPAAQRLLRKLGWRKSAEISPTHRENRFLPVPLTGSTVWIKTLHQNEPVKEGEIAGALR